MDSRSRAGARLAVLAALVFVAHAYADPVPLREVRQSLFGACFATEQDGWMVGELGRIFHTTDGGQTWDRQDAHTKRPFLAVSCVDQRTAWIAGKEGIVYGTRDAGATWTQSPTGSARHVFTLQFVTPERGHGAGDFGAMVHTEDGGRSWTVQQVPNTIEMPPNAIDIGVDPGDVNLYALSYADPDHVWLTGEFGIVMASSDGGRTWQQQRSAVDTTLFGIHFADAQHGWAVGSDSVIVRTTDGGATWRTQQSPTRERPLYDVFVTGRNGWIVGEAGTVLKSTDGGVNWGTEPLPIQLAARWIRSVWLTPGGRGLAVGAEGLVFLLDGAHLERLAHRPRPERDA